MVGVRFEVFDLVGVALAGLVTSSKERKPGRRSVGVARFLVDLLETPRCLVVQQQRSIQFKRLGFAQRELRGKCAGIISAWRA